MKIFTSIILLAILFTTNSCTEEPAKFSMNVDDIYASRSASISSANEVSFTIVHQDDLNNSSEFQAILETYNLEQESTASIDGDMVAITLRAKSNLDSPVEIGKDLSMIEEVLMVKVNNATSQNQPTS